MLGRRIALFVAAQMVLAVVAVPVAHASPPTFTKVFSPDSIVPGGVSTLTFTITTDVVTTSIAFTDTLPAGVVIATPSGATMSGCGEGRGSASLTAPDGGSTITFSDGAVGGGSTCTIDVDVTSSTVGSHDNTTGDLTSTEGNSGTATDSLTVAADRPAFSKAFSPSTVAADTRTTLTFTIDNTDNPAAASLLAFSDTFPAGMVVASPANASTTCVAGTLTAASGSDTVSYSGGAVAAGASCTVEVDVLTSAAGDSVNVSGSLTSFVSGTTRNSGVATATLTVPAVQGRLSKSFLEDPVAPGDTVDLQFTFENFDRDFPVTGLTFTDDLDATLSGLVATGTPIADPCGAGSELTGTSLLTLTGGSVPASGSCTFTVALSVPAGATPGSYPNTTSMATGTRDGIGREFTGATDTLFVAPVPLFTKEWTDDPVATGGVVTVEYSITNTSATNGATDITFIDDLTDEFGSVLSVNLPPAPDPPCGVGSTLTVVSPSFERQALSLAGGNLAASGSCTFSVTINVPSDAVAGTIASPTDELTATIDSDTVTAPPASDDLVIVRGPRLTKEFTDDPVVPGGTVTLDFTLSNPGESSLSITGIGFTDDLAATVAGITATGLPTSDLCGPGNGTLTASAGDTLLTVADVDLDAEGSCTFSVVLDVAAGATPGIHANTTSTTSGTSSGVAVTGPAASDELVIAALTVTKDFLDDPVLPGASATLEFTLTNESTTEDITGISFSDALSSFISGAAASSLPPTPCGAGSTASGTTTFLLTGGELPAGASCTFSIEVDVPGGATPDTYSNVTSTVSYTYGGGGVNGPGATDTLTVVAGLQLSKDFTDDPVVPGATAALQFTITNESPTDAATAITFTDDLDATLTGLVATGLPASDVCGVGSSVSGTSVVTLTGGSLPAGGTCAFSITLQVPGGATPGTYPNSTSAPSGTIGGLAAIGDPASDDLEIEAAPTVTFAKVFLDDLAGPSGSADLEFTITNLDAGSGVSSLSFTDDLGAALTGLTATSLPATPCGVGSSITGTSVLAFSGGDLAASGSCTFVVTVTVPAGAAPGTYTNTTSALTSSGLPVAAAASDDLRVAAVTLAKAFGAAVQPGGDVALQFTLTNLDGASAITDLNFSDDLDATLAGLVATGLPLADPCGAGSSFTGTALVTLSAGSLAAGASCVFSINVRVPAGAAPATYPNTTSSMRTQMVAIGAAATADLVVAPGESPPPAPALAMDVDPANQTVRPQQTAATAITVRNPGQFTAPDTRLTVTLPSDADLVAVPASCTLAGATLTCLLGSLAAGGGSATVQLQTVHATVGQHVLSIVATSGSASLSGSATITVDAEHDLADDCRSRPATSPDDVAESDPHGGAILCLLALDISVGFEDGSFRPELPISGAQLASLLVRAIDVLGLQLPTVVPDAFDDDNGSVHETAANRLAAAGILLGVGEREFAGDLAISRGQLAAVLVRTIELLTDVPIPPREDQFEDDDGTAFEREIDAAAQLGLVAGTSPTTFEPGLGGSRGQVASIVARFVVLVAGTS